MQSLFDFLSETRNIFSLLNCLRPYRGCWLRSATLATALSASSPSSLGTRFQQLTDEHIISDLVSSSQLSCSAQTQPYHIFLISCPLSCFFLAVTPLSCTLVTLLVCRPTVGWVKTFWRVGQFFYENGRNSKKKSQTIDPKVGYEPSCRGLQTGH